MLAPTADQELLSFFNRPGTPWLDAAMQAASNRGLLLAIAALAAIYLWLRSPHGGLSAILLGLSIGAADLISVRAVKPAVARARPCEADPTHVKAPEGCGSGRSFPSAHAADSAAAATVFAWAAPRLAPVGIALAIVVGISRVYLGEHWPSDVLGGWVLGMAVGTALIFLARLRHTVRTG